MWKKAGSTLPAIPSASYLDEVRSEKAQRPRLREFGLLVGVCGTFRPSPVCPAGVARTARAGAVCLCSELNWVGRPTFHRVRRSAATAVRLGRAAGIQTPDSWP